jgi:putative ABC transport system ATP-binding protein
MHKDYGNFMIEVKGISKAYGSGQGLFMVLDNVSFTIPDGTSVAIVGKSGSGKSSLIHAMSGLAKPDLGEIIINGQDILKMSPKETDMFRDKMIGFVFQSFFVQGHQTCAKNVSLPLEIMGVHGKQRAQMIDEALKAVGLFDKRNVRARDLSGGQKQRLAIARAIVGRPSILFADEPTGNLDSTTGQAIEQLLFWCNKNLRTTLVVVTHDNRLAEECDMQIFISDGKIANIKSKLAPVQTPPTLDQQKQQFAEAVRTASQEEQAAQGAQQ